MPTKWIHPVHARGIRSPRLDVRGQKLLTDRKIHQYAKAGFYGTEVQDAANGVPKAKRRKRENPMAQARRLLATLLK